MFRYRDAQGLERRVINEAALRQNDGALFAAVRALRAGDIARKRVVALALVAGALLAGAGFAVDYLREQQIVEQRRAYAAAMLGLAGGQPIPAGLLTSEPPLADDAALRTLWVRLHVASAIARHIDSTQAGFGVRGFLPPDGWMSDDYVAHPSKYEQVGVHWAAYLNWDRYFASRADELLRREEAHWAREAGLSERQTFELIDPEQPGLSAIGWDLDLRRELATEAHRLHIALVESRGNAFLSDGRWWFADTRTQRAYAQHVANLGRIAGVMLENAHRRAQSYGVEPGDRVVPAAIASMRPAGG